MPFMMAVAVVAVIVVCAIPAAGLETGVESRDGVPTLLVDGKPMAPMMLQYMAGGSPSPLRCRLTPQWQQFSYTFRAPTDDSNVAAHWRNIMPVGDWFVDDVRLVEGTLDEPLSDNLFAGGDFEGDEPPQDFKYFLNSSTGAAVQWSLSEDNPRRGDKCLRVRITSPGTINYHIHFYHTFAIKRGKVYTVSAWLRSDQPREVEMNALHQAPPWTTYGGASGKSDATLKLAGPRGLHLGNPPLPVIWTEPGSAPDFARLDGMVEHILSLDPDALIIPRLNLDAPQWWKQVHPDHIQVYDVGKQVMASPASQLWQRDAAAALRQTVRHLEDRFGDNMAGYHPCAQSAGEWFYDRVFQRIMPNFEKPFRAAFARWVQAKYGTVQALQRAWRDSEVTFETIQVPTMQQRLEGKIGVFRDPATQRFLIDFADYMQVCLSDYLMHCARIVKEETGGRKITVFFYGYHYELSGFPYGAQSTGHFRLREVLQCPDVDVLVSPISYGDRQSGGAGSFMCPVDSIQLHGKLWLNEDDTRTHLSAPDAGYGRADTMAQTLGIYQRNFGHQFERRCGTWWMDFGLGWMADETIFDNFAHARDTWKQRPPQGGFAPQVAIVTDEASNFVLRCSSEVTAFSVSLMRRSFNAMGCPVGLYLLDDLCEGKLPPSVRLYVFLNDFRLTDQQRKQIRQQVAKDGKVAVWLYAPGYVDDSPSAQNISDLVGMRVEQLDEPGNTRMALLGDLPTWLTGAPEAQVFGADHKLSPRFIVPEQPGVTALGKYEGTEQVGLASKQLADWTSIYCGGLQVSPEVLRGAARLAGVHVYCHTNDVISACPGFVSIHAGSAGEKTLSLPKEVAVTDLISGQELGPPTDRVVLQMQKGETRLLGW